MVGDTFEWRGRCCHHSHGQKWYPVDGWGARTPVLVCLVNTGRDFSGVHPDKNFADVWVFVCALSQNEGERN